MERPKIISSSSLDSGRFIIVKDRLKHTNGYEGVHETVKHPGAVVVLPIDNDGRLILVRQYRHSVERELLEFPAGTLETGEKPHACAERELAEEVGKRAVEWVDLGELLPAPGFSDELQYLFLARNLSAADIKHDQDEIIAVERLTVEEFERSVASGETLDGKSLAIFLRARLRKLV